MTGPWKTRKTKPRFPFVFPSPWKSLRDSHIPTAPARRGKVENQKQVSHFPTLLSSLSNPQNQTQERRPGAGSLRSRRSGSFFHEKMLSAAPTDDHSHKELRNYIIKKENQPKRTPSPELDVLCIEQLDPAVNVGTTIS